MKIGNSLINMQGRHNAVERHEKQETLRVWVDEKRPAEEAPVKKMKADMVVLSERAMSNHKAKEADMPESEMGDGNDLRALLVEKLVEMVTGQRVKITISKINLTVEEVSFPAPAREVAPAPPQREGWGVAYDYHESHYEREEMTFDASGVVKTKDGKKIDFTLHFTMNREFMEENHVRFRAGDALKIDPLVINFDGNAAQLTDEKFSFDLNSDGREDSISFVKPGSGFLTLDLNHDSIVNDGKELFGPQSGNGFAELAKYDEDGNHWIDEQDSVFNKLRIWSKDGQGNDILHTLASRNVGAIYLGQASGSFDLRNSGNVSLGEVKSTGVYFKEDGGAGTVQQIDLAA